MKRNGWVWRPYLNLEKIKLTISDKELVGASRVLDDFTRVQHFVRLLVVDEDVGGSSSLHPVLENVLVLGISEGLLYKC